MSRVGYLLLFATVLTLGAIGRPGPLLAAAVLLGVATTAHYLITDTTPGALLPDEFTTEGRS